MAQPQSSLETVEVKVAVQPPQPAEPSMARQVASEFFSTFILMIFGIGVVAQTVLSAGGAGSYLAINFAWGLAVTAGVYVGGGISGAHMNPAVTLALAVRGAFPWRKLPAYVVAQFAGAFVASATVFTVYHEALNAFDGGVRQIAGAHGTAGIWSTYPQNFLTTFPGGFIDQFVGTLLLVMLVFAVTDAKNAAPTTPGIAPILIGGVVFLIGACFGFNAGYAINPARDLAPRIFTALAGWGGGVFAAGNHWWWVPVVAPCLGGIAGALIYDLALRKPEEAAR